ncbi:MAG: fasciclin domain-containing protein, partial [Flavobacteriales bacterium]
MTTISLTTFSQTVFDIIASSPTHNTLEVAVLAAGLEGALNEPDASLTVFAPTDDAFALIPSQILDALLADPTGDLTQILLYHVVGSTALSTDLSTGMMIETLQGDDVMVTISNGVVKINNATVVIADLVASNGVVHVVDAVIQALPETVLDVVVNSESHNTLEAAVLAAGLDGALSDPDASLTVFAPTDDAFSVIPSAVLDALLADPTGDLTQILLY